jgi:hypothetical protein
MNIDLSVNAAQLPGIILAPKMHITVEGRGTGKSYDIGFLIDRLVRAFPRGVISITGQTYGQLLTRTLPSSLKVINQLSYQKDVNYVIGKKPPKWFHLSYEQLEKFDNVISFSNGARFVLISQSEKGSGRGANTDFEIVDEALTIDKEQYDYEIVPTNRGNKEFFGHIPFHHGFKYSTSMPPTKQGRWVLEYAKYYEDEAAIPIFDIWNRVVKLQLELLELDNPKQFAELWNEIQRIKKQIIPFVSKEGVLFTLANAFDNLKSIGLSYLKENKKKMPSLIFLIEMMNFLFDKVEDCFYSINEEKQLYYTALDDKSILNNAINSNYNFDLLTKQSSIYDKDCNPALPLEIVFDWNSRICLIIVCQERNYDFNQNTVSNKTYQTFINEFFVKPDENKNILIKELCDQFNDYYKNNTNRELHYFRDRYGDSKNPNVLNSKSYNQQAIEYLRKTWNVIEHVHKGNEPPQSDKYILWGNILNESNDNYPRVRFNANKCKYTLISMNNARVKDEDGRLSKDKSSERITSGVLPEEATHFSDAADKIVWTKFGTYIRNYNKTSIPIHIVHST